MKCWLCGLSMLVFSSAFSQTQTCPANINFTSGDLTHWAAYTGNNKSGNGPSAIFKRYDSSNLFPSGTKGAKVFPEYNFTSVDGIQVITTVSKDFFGGFSTIPNINGYQYHYSILLGSTAVSRGNGSGTGGPRGGYIRGVSYAIFVPPGPATEPYTMTYAYAMVLENGTHNSEEQPLFSATLTTNDSVIQCASPSYFLPTFNNTSSGSRGATLDSAKAKRNGFRLSPQLSPNSDPRQNSTIEVHLQDVWTKGWTEVTFDLSPYRGQKVTLTFEADNCIPGGHFAYAYVALRNSCAGLDISGDSHVCAGSEAIFSIPALGGATYQWIVPNTWKIISNSDTSNIIHVIAGRQPGDVIANEHNSCANLRDTIHVQAVLPAVGGDVQGGTTVCAGENQNNLLLTGSVGNILKWISTTDGINWKDIANTSTHYLALNLNTTTTYKVLVNNETSCPPDSSAGATIIVDPKTVGGNLDPANSFLCEGQNIGSILKLVGNTGQVINWQLSVDNINWIDFNPQYTDSFFIANGLAVSTQYRTIVKDGVCPADTSAIALVKKINVPFPQAVSTPADTTICYGGVAELHTLITLGTSYTWNNNSTLTGQGNGKVSSLPFDIKAKAAPLATSDYIISIENAGCPNHLNDTFHIHVLPEIIVDPGRDTAVVVNQPLQLHASSNQEEANVFTWLPVIGLDNPYTPDPIAILTANDNIVKYTVRATTAGGCYGESSIVVRVFKTGPDIFVPNAFTPGKSTNNLFRPVPVGVGSLQFFRVYNRTGQLVFSTSQIGRGWDGTIGGKPQDSGSFVWVVQGTDYTGENIYKKGIMVLIR